MAALPRYSLGRAPSFGLLAPVVGLVAAVLIMWASFTLLRGEHVLNGPRIQQELERRFGMQLAEVPPIVDSGVMANVTATYGGEHAGQRLLIVVFDSSDATAQISGHARASFGQNGRVLTRDNVVVLYDHPPGTPDLGSDIAAALADSAGEPTRSSPPVPCTTTGTCADRFVAPALLPSSRLRSFVSLGQVVSLGQASAPYGIEASR